MTILIIVLCLFINVSFGYAQEIKEVKPLYQLPNKAKIVEESSSMIGSFLVGSDSGLYRISANDKALPIWTEGRVDQIINLEFPTAEGQIKPAWLMRTDKGLFITFDLKNFEARNEGLSFLTIKKYKNK